MGAATALTVFSLVVLALSGWAPRPLLTVGGVAVRAVLLLTPSAARNAMALLNCASATVSPAGCASLNGCSSSRSSAGGRGSSVAVNLLSSNPYYVCWARGGAHNAAGGLAVAALAVAAVAFPIAFFWAVYQQQRAGKPPQRMLANRLSDDEVPEASAMVINPLRLSALSAVLKSTALPAEGSRAAAAPLLAPFLSDYRPDAWYTRHADLTLTLLLAALQVRASGGTGDCIPLTYVFPRLVVQAFIPTPVSKATLLGKAAAIITSTLALAVHTMWVRPFAPAQAWKGPVRATMLVLAAASAAVVAWAGALDLRLVNSPGASKALTAGSYALAVLFCVVIAVRVASVAAAMLRGVREEQARIRAMETLPQRRRRGELRSDGDGAGSSGTVLVQEPQSIDGGQGQSMAAAAAGSASAAGLDSTDNSAFAMNPLAVRHPFALRRRRQPKPALRDDSLATAAATLSNATASDADVVAACDGITSLLGRLTAAEARAASAALLPGLSARLTGALSGGAGAYSVTVEAVCRAMAALSDHTYAATLSAMAGSRAVEQLVSLLRKSMPGTSASHVPPSLAPALWLLGNLAADESAAAAFVEAGGAGLLVALLSALSTTATCSDKGSADVAQSARQPSGDSLLHVCVAAASVSEHAGAAAALLLAGAMPALVRCLPPQTGSGVALHSLADAAAACLALANVLRHCAVASAADAAQAASDLAACGAVAGCTSALRRATSGTDPLVVEFAARAAEALVGIVGCATAATAASDGHAAAAALAGQAAVAETEAAVMALLETAPVEGEGEDEEASRRRTLENLLMQLRPWLGSYLEDGSGGSRTPLL